MPRVITTMRTKTTHAMRIPVRRSSHPKSWLRSAATNAATEIQMKAARTRVLSRTQRLRWRVWLLREGRPAVFPDRPVRVVCDFPQMTVRVGEVAGVATIEGGHRRLGQGRAGGAGRTQQSLE